LPEVGKSGWKSESEKKYSKMYGSDVETSTTTIEVICPKDKFIKLSNPKYIQ